MDFERCESIAYPLFVDLVGTMLSFPLWEDEKYMSFLAGCCRATYLLECIVIAPNVSNVTGALASLRPDDSLLSSIGTRSNPSAINYILPINLRKYKDGAKRIKGLQLTNSVVVFQYSYSQ